MRFFPTMGGVGRYIASYVRKAPDIQFDIITNALPNIPAEERFADNAMVHRFPPIDFVEAHWQRWGRKVLLPFSAVGENLRTLRQKRYLRKDPPDVIHMHDIDKYSAETVRVLGLPMAFTDRFNKLYSPERLPAPVLLTKHFDTMLVPNSAWAAWERSFTLQYRNIIVFTEARKDFWRKEFDEHGIDPRIWVLPNGIELDLFRPGERKFPDKFTIGYAGRLDVYKGEQLLRSIVENLPDSVSFHGAFPRGERVPEWLLNLPKDKCSVSYDIPYERMPEFYKSVDLMINTTVISASDRSILEPMACGVPVIRVAAGDDFPVVNGENGLSLPPDPREFISAISRLKDGRQMLESFSRKCREPIAERYDADRLAAKLKEIYLEIAES